MKTQTVRIIAGKWRSRKISFPEVATLCPTGDRVRETLFNWLGTAILKLRVLDCFAGSGALGFEALSRGAKEVVFFDASSEVIQQLIETAKQLQTDAIEVYQITAPNFPRLKPFELIFLDPPFKKGMLEEAITALQMQALIAENALIYCEVEKSRPPLQVPKRWQCLKEKTAGDVRFYLYQVNNSLV